MEWINENFWTFMLLVMSAIGCGSILLLASLVVLVVYLTKRKRSETLPDRATHGGAWPHSRIQ
jgi:hypothetical protein